MDIDPRDLEYLDQKVSEAIDAHNEAWEGPPMVTVHTAALDALIAAYKEKKSAAERYKRLWERQQKS